MARLAAALMLVFVPRPMIAQACKAADAHSVSMIDDVVELVTTTDPDEAAGRSDYGLLAAPSSEVSLVQDNKTCTKALVAYTAAAVSPGSPQPTAVYVVRVGSGPSTRYVVMAKESQGPRSEFLAYVVFDTKFAVVGAFTE